MLESDPMACALFVDASCQSNEENSAQTITKVDYPNLPAVTLRSSAAITFAQATSIAESTRSSLQVSAATNASPPYSQSPSSKAKATCDVVFSYTINMPGQSGTGYLKPLLAVQAGVGEEALAGNAAASLGGASINVDGSRNTQQIFNATRIPFSFGNPVDLPLHLEASSAALVPPDVATQIGSQATAQFTGEAIYLSDDEQAPEVTSQCNIERRVLP